MGVYAPDAAYEGEKDSRCSRALELEARRFFSRQTPREEMKV
jgi:hypothetical protein